MPLTGGQQSFESRIAASHTLITVRIESMAQRDHQRTVAYLRSADTQAMTRRAVLYEGFSMSAAEIAQLPLCAHLEIHLDQLERTVRP